MSRYSGFEQHEQYQSDEQKAFCNDFKKTLINLSYDFKDILIDYNDISIFSDDMVVHVIMGLKNHRIELSNFNWKVPNKSIFLFNPKLLLANDITERGLRYFGLLPNEIEINKKVSDFCYYLCTKTDGHSHIYSAFYKLCKLSFEYDKQAKYWDEFYSKFK